MIPSLVSFPCRKFEEIYPPEVSEFVYITDDTYTKKQVLRMEHLVLKVLSFDLAAPTINQFLTQYILHQPVSLTVECLAMVSPEWGFPLLHSTLHINFRCRLENSLSCCFVSLPGPPPSSRVVS